VASVETASKQWVQTLAFSPRYSRAATPVRFVVLTRPRTGSTLLLELLHAHPDIYSDGELLKRRSPSVPVQPLIKARAVRVRRVSGASAYGFKAMVGQVLQLPHWSTFVSTIHEHGFKIIYLDRRDLLLQALSLEFANQTDRWQMRDDSYVDFEPFAVDVDAVVRTMERLDHHRTLAEEMMGGLPRHNVVYEDDLLPPEAHQRTADAACEFLGFDSASVVATLLPMAPPEGRQRVTNYDELTARLSTTRFAKYLEPQAGQPE